MIYNRKDRKEKQNISEETLFALFDYQQFESNPELAALIAETESEYSGEISDDDLLNVSAAGEASPQKERKLSEDGTV